MSTRAFAAENWIENRFYRKLIANKNAKYKTLKLLAFQHPVVGFVRHLNFSNIRFRSKN